MVKIDNSPRRRRGGAMGWLIVIMVILVAAAWLTAPRRTTNADSGTQLANAGVVAPGAKPSTSLVHPGSMTLGRPGTDSRDNGTPKADARRRHRIRRLPRPPPDRPARGQNRPSRAQGTTVALAYYRCSADLWGGPA